MENNSRCELGSLKKQHFGKVPNILNSLSPSGPICVTVTRELSLTLLTSGFWLRLDSRATVRGQDNPKDVSSPPHASVRESDCCCSVALWTTSVETFCPDGPTMHATRNRARSNAVCQDKDIHCWLSVTPWKVNCYCCVMKREAQIRIPQSARNAGNV